MTLKGTQKGKADDGKQKQNTIPNKKDAPSSLESRSTKNFIIKETKTKVPLQPNNK